MLGRCSASARAARASASDNDRRPARQPVWRKADGVGRGEKRSSCGNDGQPHEGKAVREVDLRILIGTLLDAFEQRNLAQDGTHVVLMLPP